MIPDTAVQPEITLRWRRVLWEKSPYPDNFIPPDSFLSALRRNPNFTPYSYCPLLFLCCAITQHLATVFVFLAIFVRLKERLLDARVLLWISVTCSVLGYGVWEILHSSNPSRMPPNRSKAFKSSLLVLLALMGLAPVLRTLTAATSSDSIWALSACLFLLNTLLADYSCMRSGSFTQERLTSVLSMNAAMSSSVVLASRLPDDLSVFSLVLFAVQLFALFPLLRHRLWAISTLLQALVTLSITAVSLVLVTPLSTPIATIMAGLYIAVSFIAPGVLVWAQKYKKHVISMFSPGWPPFTSILLQRNQRSVGCRHSKTELDLTIEGVVNAPMGIRSSLPSTNG
ncbi:phosphatidylinositol N-acetylglucosaminyltransferase [Butyriboletus roseoflavus]|nr:phosphatidylinositol N-acetylglucosaminyltransferase [Butyriboletus roseoflavus]